MGAPRIATRSAGHAERHPRLITSTDPWDIRGGESWDRGSESRDLYLKRGLLRAGTRTPFAVAMAAHSLDLLHPPLAGIAAVSSVLVSRAAFRPISPQAHVS